MSKRKAYLDDFHRSVDGEYVYEGEHYLYCGEKSYKRTMLALWALCLASFAAVVLCGCIPAAGMSGCAYVILPYAASCIAVVSLCWAMANLAQGGKRLRAYTYEKTVKALPARAMLNLILCVLTLCGELVFLAINGAKGKLGATVLFIALELLAAAASFLIRRAMRSFTWEKEKLIDKLSAIDKKEISL